MPPLGQSDAKRMAPDTLSLIVCPCCGRTDRFAQLKREGKHYTYGKLCSGEPEVIKYVKASQPWKPAS